MKKSLISATIIVLASLISPFLEGIMLRPPMIRPSFGSFRLPVMGPQPVPMIRPRPFGGLATPDFSPPVMGPQTVPIMRPRPFGGPDAPDIGLPGPLPMALPLMRPRPFGGPDALDAGPPSSLPMIRPLPFGGPDALDAGPPSSLPMIRPRPFDGPDALDAGPPGPLPMAHPLLQRQFLGGDEPFVGPDFAFQSTKQRAAMYRRRSAALLTAGAATAAGAAVLAGFSIAGAVDKARTTDLCDALGGYTGSEDAFGASCHLHLISPEICGHYNGKIQSEKRYGAVICRIDEYDDLERVDAKHVVPMLVKELCSKLGGQWQHNSVCQLHLISPEICEDYKGTINLTPPDGSVVCGFNEYKVLATMKQEHIAGPATKTLGIQKLLPANTVRIMEPYRCTYLGGTVGKTVVESPWPNTPAAFFSFAECRGGAPLQKYDIDENLRVAYGHDPATLQVAKACKEAGASANFYTNSCVLYVSSAEQCRAAGGGEECYNYQSGSFSGVKPLCDPKTEMAYHSFYPKMKRCAIPLTPQGVARAKQENSPLIWTTPAECAAKGGTARALSPAEIPSLTYDFIVCNTQPALTGPQDYTQLGFSPDELRGLGVTKPVTDEQKNLPEWNPKKSGWKPQT